MDAHAFRPLASRLAQQLAGARIDKIFRPAPAHWTLALSNPAHREWSKRFLLLKVDKQDGVLFLSTDKPANPAVPVAEVMWLRKRLTSRRMLEASIDWLGLRLALGLTPGKHGGRYIVFDLRSGITLVDDLEPGFSQEPPWPPFSGDLFGDSAEAWRQHQVLTPALRKHLATLPRPEAAQIYDRLSHGPPDALWIASDASGFPKSLTAWQSKGSAERFDDFILAAQTYGGPRFFAGVDLAAEKPDDEAVKAQRKRIKRSLKHVEADERRLQDMADAKTLAEALQAELYKYSGHPTPESITVHHPSLGEVEIELNTHLSVAENMEKMFTKAAKGRRGLDIIAARREQLEAELKNPSAPAPGTKHGPQAAPGKRPTSAPIGTGKRLKGALKDLPVGRYVTSDGFTVLKGKNSKANHKLLSQAASAFDYWFHASGRPGAHVILKRDHPNQEVPEQSLEQAAILAAISSGFAEETRADVMCALVKDVRKIKGAAHGLVRVDQVWRTLRIELDHDLPAKLSAE